MDHEQSATRSSMGQAVLGSELRPLVSSFRGSLVWELGIQKPASPAPGGLVATAPRLLGGSKDASFAARAVSCLYRRLIVARVGNRTTTKTHLALQKLICFLPAQWVGVVSIYTSDP